MLHLQEVGQGYLEEPVERGLALSEQPTGDIGTAVGQQVEDATTFMLRQPSMLTRFQLRALTSCSS
jgi:hypothetical protein